MRLNSTLSRYIITGGGAYLLEMAVLFCLKHLHLGNVTSVAISFWIGLVTAFLLQKFFAFKEKTVKKLHLTRQATQYLALVGFNYLLTLVFVALVATSITVFGARTIAIGMTTLWNYYFYKKHIFTSPPAGA